MHVCQSSFKGSVDDLASELIATWKSRWMRHAEVPVSRWDAILAFAQAKLPKGHLSWPSLDPTALRHVILAKNQRTAAGLDGVSITDMRSMPANGNVLSNFCQIFAHAESTGDWPSQMINGRVQCLAKTSDPGSALRLPTNHSFGFALPLLGIISCA